MRKIITIIGSMKFYNIILSEAERLESEGNNVMIPYKSPLTELTDAQKTMYDELIRDKIDLSNEVYVVNPGGYIGNSVESEIEYAINRCKIPVSYYYNGKSPIITLCGSRNFESKFIEVYRTLTLQGNIVLTPSIFEFSPREIGSFTSTQHDTLDRNHRQKIEMADEVFIVNVDGYYGDNTREEILYAKAMNKNIRFLVPLKEGDEFYEGGNGDE